MHKIFAFPEWFEDKWLDDETFAQAYDEIALKNRYAIKTAIARHFILSRNEYSHAKQQRESFTQGFQLEQNTEKVAWVIVYIQGKISPAQLLAAIIPAMSQGIEQVAIVMDDKKNISQELLVSLELAGATWLAVLTKKELDQLLSVSAKEHFGLVVSVGENAKEKHTITRKNNQKILWLTLNMREYIGIYLQGEVDREIFEQAKIAHKGSIFKIAGKTDFLSKTDLIDCELCTEESFLEEISEIYCSDTARHLFEKTGINIYCAGNQWYFYWDKLLSSVFERKQQILYTE